MTFLSESGAATGVVLAALALVIGMLLLRWNRYFRRQPKDQPAVIQLPRPKAKGPGHNLDAPKQFTEWEVEMYEVARELSARLDSKMSALQNLIREADRASDRLKAILAAGARSGGFDLPPDFFDAEPSGAADVTRSGVGPFSAFGRKRGEGETEQESPVEHRYAQICQLADQGFDAERIAGQVGVPVGEVMLILGLRGRG